MSLFTLTMSNQVTIDPFCTVNRFKEASLLMMFRTTSDDISSYTLQNYIDGYGAMNTPYWLGLKYIAIITSLQNQLMRIEYITFDWQTVIHEYDGFRIEDNITYSMNYDQFSAKSDGKCMELKCHSDDTCLTRDDICTNIFTQKCLDDSDINFCGDFDAVFQYGDSYGLGYVYHEAMTYKNCLKTCLLSWKGGDTAIDAVTWHFDNKCYCMKHFNGLKPITHGNEVCIYSKQGCKFFPASASLARQKYQQYHNKANGESCVEACTNFKNDGGIVQTVMYNKDTKYCHCINDNVIHGYRTTLLQNITVACTSGVFCEGRCVDKKKLCDGFDDCRDTRDEKFCPTWKINNMKCDFGAPFTACTNKGHWWSNCRGENNRANAPTIPGNIQWNHDNIRALKITLSKSTILKKNMAACQDFYKGKMCRESKYLRVSQDVEVPCYPKATSRQIYTRILYRREGLQINITTNHIFNGSTNGRFQWVGFNNFAKFFADKPKEITIFRQRRENWKPRTYFYNFTTSLDGTRIFYDKKVGDVSNLPQNTSFGKCDAEQPYWWWGCTYMQPLYETTVKRFHFYSESQLTRFYWIDIIENMT